MSEDKHKRTVGKAAMILLMILSFVGDFMFARWFVQSQIGAEKLLGDAKTKVYHYPQCRHAHIIGEEDKVWFSDPQEARKQGYTPCVFCKPH